MTDDQPSQNTQGLINTIDNLIGSNQQQRGQSSQLTSEVSTQEVMENIDQVLGQTVKDEEPKLHSISELESHEYDTAGKEEMEAENTSNAENIVPPPTESIDISPDLYSTSPKIDSSRGDSVTSSNITFSGKVDQSRLLLDKSEEELLNLGESVRSSHEEELAGDDQGRQPVTETEERPPITESPSTGEVLSEDISNQDLSGAFPASQGFKSNMFLPRSMRKSIDARKSEKRKEVEPDTISEKQESEISQTVKKSKIENEDIADTQGSDRVTPLDTDDAMATCVDVEDYTTSCTFRFDMTPYQVTGAWDEFDKTAENYLRGCKWSPDGSCVLTNSNDNYLRLFNMPEQLYTGSQEALGEMTSVLKMKESELVYDFSWYPQMNSSDPASCCFVSTSRETPIHMWDAFTGKLRCSFRAFNQVDEVTAAHSLAFNTDGTKLYSGFNKMIRVFDTARPGRDFQKRPTYSAKQGQSGIISCIAVSPTERGLYAAGSYSRTIALYHEPKGEMSCMFQGQQGGVTHLMFSPDGNKLYCGGRKDPDIVCWDLRNPGHILFVATRNVQTNQRIYFDLDSTGQYLLSGNHDGSVSVWDTLQPPTCSMDSEPLLSPVLNYQTHTDVVNGLSIHPTMPVMCTASGQRHYPALGDSDDSDVETASVTDSIDYSVRLWWFPQDTDSQQAGVS